MSYSINHHKKAFFLWLSHRNMSDVRHNFGKNAPAIYTLNGWAKGDFPCPCGFHGYKALAARISVKADAALEEQAKKNNEAVNEMLDSRALEDSKTLKLLRSLRIPILNAIKGGTLVIRTVSDAANALEKIIKAERLILGESTEIIKSDSSISSQFKVEADIIRTKIKEIEKREKDSADNNGNDNDSR